MSGIFFDPNGAAMNRDFNKDEIDLIIQGLKNLICLDIASGTPLESRGLKKKLCEKFQEIKNHVSESKDRSVTLVVHEPVEYDYDDLI